MKKRQPQTPSIEESAEAYRKCIMSLDGDLDGADLILAEAIRPHCQALMKNYGLAWDSTLEQFLHAVLLGYDRYSGEKFLSFFLRCLRQNFTLPKIDRPDYSGTGLRTFQERWESHPERHSISRVDDELLRKRRAEERAAAAADPAEQQEN